jgi:hypothetical protein
MPVKYAFVFGGVIQGVVFLFVPLIVNNTNDYYAFVFMITVSGIVLAVLTTLGPVILKQLWGEVNFNKAVGSTVFTSGVAVWVGPITSYALVTDNGDKLGASTSVFFYGFGVLSLVSGIAMLFSSPYKYQRKAAPQLKPASDVYLVKK